LTTLFYLRLIGLTTGTVVYLFLIALILGHRRPRTLERLLFFLLLGLFLIHAGGLLEINSRIEYTVTPDATRLLYSVLIALGLLVVPGLMVHSHLQFFEMAAPSTVPRWAKLLVLLPLYVAPALSFLLPYPFAPVPRSPGVRFGPSFGPLGQISQRLVRFFFWTPEATYLFIAVLLSLAIGLGILNLKPKLASVDRKFFAWMIGIDAATLTLLLVTQFYRRFETPQIEALSVALIGVSILPGVIFGNFALRHNFLDFGEQRNLLYALSATALALLYLALVRRVSGWLEPVLPSEATAAILLFALIFLFEPMERLIGPALQRRFRERVERLQRLSAEIQIEARRGDVNELAAFAEQRIKEEFGLAAVRLRLGADEMKQTPLASPGGLGHSFRLPLVKNGETIGALEAASTGVYLTGETTGALQFLAEQMPALMDLARLIEEKVQLERELSERERMAVLGQMAASVSHNLRNPLSSMKTILQVQMESPSLPVAMHQDFALVVSEIDRMSAKLTQLLQFSKEAAPSTNGQSVEAVGLAREAVEFFRRDAERRGVRVQFDGARTEVRPQIFVRAQADALNEVLSNLVLNAVEAQPMGGSVCVGVTPVNGVAEIFVQDDGPGISAEALERIFQPFYTTKATGTGLGLSIVARRAAEMGGEVVCESPADGVRGTRFRVRIPMATA
jgi:signal transduction histidine kinase